MKFSVLMSVYKKENPQFLQEAIDSIFNQSLIPTELVIVQDGPLTEGLYTVLDKASGKYPHIIKRHVLKLNMGLGLALRRGVELCRYDWIARMDSDDISDYTRFSKQLECVQKDAAIDIIGSNIIEFTDSTDTIVAKRVMPETHEEIKAFSRRRNPFAHPSVMFRKSAALEAGNYRDYPSCEDYDLWTRMIKNGARCYNIQQNLVSMRTSSDFYKRRGGIKYLRSIIRFKYHLAAIGYSSKADFLASSASSLVIGIMPADIRSWIYESLRFEQY